MDEQGGAEAGFRGRTMVNLRQAPTYKEFNIVIGWKKRWRYEF